ncbi:Nucleotide-binding, alpha-beta plait [Artemisia annua]|uniref:Nucleotide-binding, alpha-beta plait n=1 Tax=Artemisia annua TaxID=35608 RepID=A0A2U1M9F3_ARTAN|nr:Nucleotide-binding, alpha-beta plait [Artemisia annua]
MARDKDAPPAVRVYTVCDESKNVPALGCGDELRKLFEGYGQIDEFVPLDDEECEPFTDVYWIKFHQNNNARFEKEVDESIFHWEIDSISYDKIEPRAPGEVRRARKESSSSLTFFQPSTSLATRFSDECHIPRPKGAISWIVFRDYFPVESMNQTVRLVREKLNKIESDAETLKAGSSKKPRTDNRRRI